MVNIVNHAEYFKKDIEDYGISPQGAGWKSQESQDRRFEQLAKIITSKYRCSLNDVGCGFGDLFFFLRDKGIELKSYTGYEISAKMLSVAEENRSRFTSECSFIHMTDCYELQMADYSVTSGIFNLKPECSEAEWLSHILKTIEVMNRNSLKGFAFNMLTKYSDKEYMRKDLYYADPCFFFDYCKRNFSRNVALLHDYEEYDFTILVRK